MKSTITVRLPMADYASAHGITLRKEGSLLVGICPFHHDTRPSFQVDPKKQTWTCRGACDTHGDIFAFVQKLRGIGFREAFKLLALEAGMSLNGDSAEARKIADIYDYQDKCGNLLFQCVRYEPKDFTQRRPDGNGGWTWDLKGVKPLLYHLPKLLATDPISPVFVVEGEKDVHTLEALGLVATTNPMGAGKWRPEYSESLAGRNVVVLPDNDQAGREHASAVTCSLTGKAKSIKVVELPGLAEKGDSSNWLSMGHTKEEFLALVAGAPEWKPPEGVLECQNSIGENLAPLKNLAPLIAVCLADVQAEKVSWLWPPYIPLGKVTALEGDPGLGKSWVALAVATGVSLGRGLPNMQPTAPATALILTAEDGLADTVRPRLDAMGANVSRVFALDGPLVLDEAGLEEIEKHIAAMRPALVVYDPLVAYLGGQLDLHRSNETREVMAALARLAEKYGCAILVIRHLTKGAKDRAIYRGIGSIDITAACRSVLLAGCAPQDPKKRAIVQTKNNLAEFGPAVGYCLENGNLFWTGDSDLTASRILAPDVQEDGKSALEEAVDFLRDALAEGERPVTDVQKEARGAGIQERTLDRAKAQLGIRAERRNKPGGKRGEGEWVWSLSTLPVVQEGSSVQGCQDSTIETLAPLIGAERKEPPNGQGAGTLEQPKDPALLDPWGVKA